MFLVFYLSTQEVLDGLHPEQKADFVVAANKQMHQKALFNSSVHNLTELKKEEEYAILTNIIHREWSDVTVKEHKKIKGLKTQNLRDHMSEAELIFTALAELSTRQIAESVDATGMKDNKIAGIKGGRIAKKARLELEAKTGKKVVTGESFLPPAAKRQLTKKT